MKYRRALGAAALFSIATLIARLLAAARLRRWERGEPASVRDQDETVVLDGIGLRVRDAGARAVERRATPLLLIHGFGASMFSFRHQIDEMAQSRRVTAIDLPGFGYSDRPLDADLSHSAHVTRLISLMDRLGIERAVIVGHSMGGAIALRLAAEHPGRVAGLVLAGAAHPNQRPPSPLVRLMRPLLPLVLATFVGTGRLRAQLRRMVYDPAFITDEVAAGYIEPLRLRGTAATLINQISSVSRDQPVAVQTITAPTLLLWGESDRVVPPPTGARLLADLPASRIEMISRAGHFLLEEQPQACNRAINAFLEEVDSTTPDRYGKDRASQAVGV